MELARGQHAICASFEDWQGPAVHDDTRDRVDKNNRSRQDRKGRANGSSENGASVQLQKQLCLRNCHPVVHNNIQYGLQGQGKGQPVVSNKAELTRSNRGTVLSSLFSPVRAIQPNKMAAGQASAV